MKRVFAAILAVVLVSGASRAAAEPIEIGQVAQGPIYYSRPHASLTQHDADVAACMATAPLPPTQAQQLASGVRAGPYDTSFMNNLIWSGPIAGLRAARVENCMLLHGWRAVRPSPADTASLNAMAPREFEAAMAALVGAERPSGEVVRVFANEALRPGDYHTASRPNPPSKSHLSLKLFQLRGGVYPTGSAQPEAPSALDPAWPARAIKLEAVSTAPPGAALIVVRVTGISNRYGLGVSFSRLPATGAAPSRSDRRPDSLSASIGYMFAKPEGNWFVLAVAPGRWHIARSGVLDYCLGAPSFEARAGEVVYAGTFHLEGPVLGPELDLAPARQYLAGLLADRVTPAAYRNGASQACSGFSVTYGLEFPGLSFDPAYDGGSVALSRQSRGRP